jgi:hypothetical protein
MSVVESADSKIVSLASQGLFRSRHVDPRRDAGGLRSSVDAGGRSPPAGELPGTPPLRANRYGSEIRVAEQPDEDVARAA